MNIVTLLRDVPWEIYYDAKRIVKKNWADKELEEGLPALLINGDPEQLETELKATAFFEDAEYEYHIEGQVWGLRRAANVNDEGIEMELHIRAIPQSRGLLILPHWEANRYTESGEHLSGDWVYRDAGVSRARELLLELGYSPTRVTT